MPEAKPESLYELFKVFLSFGFLTLQDRRTRELQIKRELVRKRKWVTKASFNFIAEFCERIPGMQTQKIAIHLGWYLRGIPGGVAAGIAYCLPGSVALLVLSILYMNTIDSWIGQAVCIGLTPAALAILFDSLLRYTIPVGLKSEFYLVAGSSFILLYAFRLPFIATFAAGLAIYFIFKKIKAKPICSPVEHPETDTDSCSESEQKIKAHADPALEGTRDSVGSTAAFLKSTLSNVDQTFFTILLCIGWLTPIIVLLLALGPSHSLVTLTLLFLKAILIAFGDIPGVFVYIAEQAVTAQHWLTTAQLTHAIALAEAVPGPSLLALQFIGYIVGFTLVHTGELAFLSPNTAGIIGSFLAFWATVVPAFLLVLTLAPYSMQVRFNAGYNNLVNACRAVLYGACFYLILWLAGRMLFQYSIEFSVLFCTLELPLLESMHFTSAVLTLVALYVKLYLQQSNFSVVYTCIPLGLLMTILEMGHWHFAR